jgi:hypothetical protein
MKAARTGSGSGRATQADSDEKQAPPLFGGQNARWVE